MPVQMPSMMTDPPQAPLLIQAPAITDMTPLEQRLRLQQEIMGANLSTSPTTLAGGIARLAGAIGSALAARRTQSTIDDTKVANAKALAAALKGVLPDNAAPFLAAMDPNQVAPFAIEAIQKKQQADAIAKALAPSADTSNGPLAKAAFISTPSPASGGRAAFNDWYNKYLLPQEGTEYTADDGNGAPARYGINQKTDGVDVSKITPEQAKDITYQYWQRSGAGDMPPALAAIHADTAFNMGPGAAAKLLAASGGDPQKYLQIRADRYQAIAQNNPKLAKYLRGWTNRNRALAQYAQQVQGSAGDWGSQDQQPAPAQSDKVAKIRALVLGGVPLDTAISVAKATDSPAVVTADAQGNIPGLPGPHVTPGSTFVMKDGVPSLLQAPPAPKNPVAAHPGDSFYDPATGKISTPVKSDYDRLYGDTPDADKKSDVQRRMYDMSAWSFLQTGKLPALGFKNNDARMTIMQRAGDLAQKVGLDPQDIASLQAGFGASAAGLKKIGQYSTMMQGFQNALDKNADLALSLIGKGAGTVGAPVFNRWQRFAKGQYGGDPDVVALNNAVLTLNNAYAKISSGSIGSSGSTDSARTASHEALNADMTIPQMKAAIGIMKKEAANEIGGFASTQRSVVEGMKAPFTGNVSLPIGAGGIQLQQKGTPPAAGFSIDDLLKKYGVPNGN